MKILKYNKEILNKIQTQNPECFYIEYIHEKLKMITTKMSLYVTVHTCCVQNIFEILGKWLGSAQVMAWLIKVSFCGGVFAWSTCGSQSQLKCDGGQSRGRPQIKLWITTVFVQGRSHARLYKMVREAKHNKKRKALQAEMIVVSLCTQV